MSVILSALAANAYGADVVSPAAGGHFKGNVQLGVVVTTGNTKTKNVNFKAVTDYVAAPWHHRLEASALNASTKGATTAERYYVDGKSEYNVTKHNYLFGEIIYDNNRFSGFNYLITETVGYGRNIISRPTLTLDAEIGGGARESRIITPAQPQSEGVVQAAGNLEWALSATSTFSQKLSTTIGQRRSVTRSVTALKTQIVGNLATDLSYTAEYTSQVPAGVAKTFTQTSIALVYNF